MGSLGILCCWPSYLTKALLSGLLCQWDGTWLAVHFGACSCCPMPTESPFPSLKPCVEEVIEDFPGDSRAAPSGVEICLISGLHLTRGLSYTRIFLNSSLGPSQTKARTPLPFSYLEFY